MRLTDLLVVTTKLKKQATRKNPRITFLLNDVEITLSNTSYFQKEDNISLHFYKKINIKKKENRNESDSKS